MSSSGDSEFFIDNSDDKSPKPRRCRILVPFMAISFIINIILVIVFLTTVVLKSSLLKVDAEDKDRSPLCFDCSYLGPDVETTDVLMTIHRSENWTLCCVEDETLKKQARQIMKADTKETAKQHSSKTTELFKKLRKGKVGAHLFIDTQALNNGDLSWSYTGVSSSTGVEYHGDSLHILTSGKYLVYSHVAIHRKFPGTHGGDTFVHRLTRYNPRQPNLGEVNLLLSKHSYPEYTARKSSFLSGALTLHSGDELSIHVSDTDSISDNPTSSYFGVIKL